MGISHRFSRKRKTSGRRYEKKKKKKKKPGLQIFRQQFSAEKAQDTGSFLQRVIFWAKGCWKNLLLMLAENFKGHCCLSGTAMSW